MTAPAHPAVLSQVLLAVEDGSLPLVVARGGGSGAAVVVMPSAFAIGPDLEAQLSELAESATLVAALDPFFRDGGGFVPYHDLARVKARMEPLDRARAGRDLYAVIEWARGQAPAVVALGICFGGPFVLEAAADGIVDGAVTWHGTRLEQYLERAAQMRCPLRLHFGAADPITPPPVVDAIRAAFAGRDDVRVVVHPGATHGFSHRGAPQAWNAAAERAGMEAVRELATSLGGA